MKPEYCQTIFQTPCENLPEEFYIITAHNPDGETIDPSGNNQRDQKLSRDLENMGSSKFRITGMSPDRSHSEASWGINCSQDIAINMGRKYRQDAIFRVSGDQLFLIDCRDATETKCGQFTLVA